MAADDRRVQEYFERYANAFDRIYHEPNPIQRFVNRLRRRSMFERFRLTLEVCGDVHSKRILDVGCGSGRYAVELARRGADVLGVDFSQPMLDIANRLAEDAGVAARCHFLQGNIIELSLKEGFDESLAIGFFDYTEDPRPILEVMRRVTRHRLIASFPTRHHPLSGVRKLRLSLAGCPVYFYTRSQLEELLQWPGTQLRLQGLGRDDLAVVEFVQRGGS